MFSENPSEKNYYFSFFSDVYMKERNETLMCATAYGKNHVLIFHLVIYQEWIVFFKKIII